MISISVSAATADGTGLGAHIVNNHPLIHLLFGNTATGPWGEGVDVDINALTGINGSIPGPLVSLADALSSIAPQFLHVGFNSEPLPPGLSLNGTGIHSKPLGIDQILSNTADSTLVTFTDLLK